MSESPRFAIRPGVRDPLGASFDGFGTNFAVFSEPAHAVELCLFDPDGTETRIPMPEVDGYVWHVYLPGVGPGTRYGYRVHGPWDPSRGLWCNPNKLLADPYARMFDGEVVHHAALLAHDVDRPDRPSALDSAPYTKRSLVVSGAFDWQGDRAPAIPLVETVLYEGHVKGLTVMRPDVHPIMRGTYLGVADPAMIAHYKRIGVTAVELLPVHQSVSEPFLDDLGLTNYWGYNTFGFFAPHRAYGASAAPEAVVGEFKAMVRELHRAGIEVILDVVYNHTAEGGSTGPTFSLRGFDNPAYYRLNPDRRSEYVDTTGVGNSLNMNHPMSLRLVMDSLRYWVSEMHVDGFRFDLAATLGREGAGGVDKSAAFFDLIAQDPVLSTVKLIAEPWDLGPGGYQVGNFPPGWVEWNGMFRDTVRDFWRGRPGTVPSLASRLAGSSDLYADDGRHPWASVNFVTAHDGFTLADLVSYEQKHNEANLENNRDGTDDNRSANYGVEGPTNDPSILETRARQQRNFLATVLLAQGVPMLLAGDERGRTQGGNNNAYAQDNPIAWLDWSPTPQARDLERFTARCTGLRAAHPVLRRKRFLLGLVPGEAPAALPDVLWLRPDGAEMSPADWRAGYSRSLGMFLNGEALPWLDRLGEPVRDSSFLLLLNAWDQAIDVTLPGTRVGREWLAVLDTTHATGEAGQVHAAGDRVRLAGRAVLVLERTG